MKLILRFLKSFDFGLSDGYVFDYNFFFKFIGVYLVLLLMLSLLELELYCEF